MDRTEVEGLIDSLFGLPSETGEPQAAVAALSVIREIGFAAFSDAGIDRLLEAQKDLLAAEMRR